MSTGVNNSWDKSLRRFSKRGFWKIGNSIARREWQAAAKLCSKWLLEGELRILDIGAGQCIFWNFANHTSKPVVLDKSLISLKSIDGRFPGIRADAIDLPIRSNTINVLICLGLSEYIREISLFFEETRRISRPGGRMLITNSPATLPNRFRSYMDKRVKPRQNTEFINKLNDAGWELIPEIPTHAGLQTLFALITTK